MQAQLDRHANNILYSDNKLIRARSRTQFRLLTKDCTAYPKCTARNQTWVKLADWVEQTFNRGIFPFIADRTRVTYATQSVPTVAVPIVPAGRSASVTVAILALMAFGVNPHGGAAEVLRFNQQCNLLTDEGFKDTGANSRAEAARSLKIVAGANYPYSLDSRVNRLAKQTIRNIGSSANQMISVVGFTWFPFMIDADSKQQVDIKVAKRLIRFIRDMDNKLSKRMARQAYLNKAIPMNLIRNTIKDSNEAVSALARLRHGYMGRPVLAFTCDSDAVSLRTGNEGIFSIYQRMFRDNYRLMVASTGYIMDDGINDFIRAASELDRYCRVALGRAAYLPEPNLCTRVPIAAPRGLGFKYGKGRNTRVFGLESDRVIKSYNLNYRNSSGKIAFGERGPIITGHQRATVPAGLTGRLRRNDYKDPQTIKAFRQFMQASFDPLVGFSEQVLRALPGMGIRPNKVLIKDIFDCYDPIEFAQYFPRSWFMVYEEYMEKFIQLSNRTPAKRDVEATVDSILHGITGVKPARLALINYMKNTLNDLDNLDVKLNQIPGMNPVISNFVYQSAINVSWTLFEFFEHKINGMPFVMPNLPQV